MRCCGDCIQSAASFMKLSVVCVLLNIISYVFSLLLMASNNGAADIRVSKCGIRFSPPALILTYCKESKIRRRTMPIRGFNKNSSVERFAEDLRSKPEHRRYLESVPLPQLEKLLEMIRVHLNGTSKDVVIANAKKTKDVDDIDPDEDLNKVDEQTLLDKKAMMDKTFEKNRIRPGDPDFKYEVEKEFDIGPIETNDWDESDKDYDEGF